MLKRLRAENRAQVATCSEEQGLLPLGRSQGQVVGGLLLFLLFPFPFSLYLAAEGKGAQVQGEALTREPSKERQSLGGGALSMESYQPTE